MRKVIGVTCVILGVIVVIGTVIGCLIVKKEKGKRGYRMTQVLI